MRMKGFIESHFFCYSEQSHFTTLEALCISCKLILPECRIYKILFAIASVCILEYDLTFRITLIRKIFMSAAGRKNKNKKLLILCICRNFFVIYNMPLILAQQGISNERYYDIESGLKKEIVKTDSILWYHPLDIFR